MRNENLRQATTISLYAALIFISVQALRIPMGAQFIHFGNALVVVGVLLYGAKRGAIAASIGLGIFDLLNGYASSAWITILESLIVCFILYFFYDQLFQRNDKQSIIISVGLIAAISKIIMNFVKYTILNSLIGGMTVNAGMIAALLKIGGTYGSAIATILAVPILYPILKNVSKKGYVYAK